jgi:trehalose 6-phosphate synthase/phosphatase
LSISADILATAGSAPEANGRRLVIVSNRLPFSVADEQGALVFRESPGGLVSGLTSYLHGLRNELPYLWIGWPGATIPPGRREEVRTRAAAEFHSLPVFLTQEDMDAFYLGFCNKTLWPLFHYFPSFTAYRDEYWKEYLRVNEMFCDAVVAAVRPGDALWVHDYHLMVLPRMLKNRLPPAVPIGFFLHIPFPAFEIFRLLPVRWRRELLEGVLGADLAGFHTFEYVQYFLQSVRRVLGYEHQMGRIATPDRIVGTGTFPMGLDFATYDRTAASAEAQAEQEEIRRQVRGARIILSVDRQDYTKGILNRLEGYERLLETCPEFREHVVLVMVVVPSRVGVDQYDLMKQRIEELVGRINGKFGSVAWSPVVYQYRSLPVAPLIALYTASDIALVTPLRDGMNLVAKEYMACRQDDTGVLVLSEMAGSVKELGEAIVINPNNPGEIADALREALEMTVEEQKRRNGIMRNRLKRYTVSRWAEEFLRGLTDIGRIQEDYLALLLPGAARKRMIAEYGCASRRLLLLDYDGTLVPIARRPHLARPGADLLKLLGSLCGGRTTCVIVSGRDRMTLQSWFADLPVNLVAEHGIWSRSGPGGGAWELMGRFSGEWKEALLPVLQSYADRLPGSFVEEKEYSLAWHYRTADPEQAEPMVGEVTDHLLNLAGQGEIQILRGHRVLEVRNAGANKGNAVRQWMSRGDFDFMFACGDDQTDEDMFQALPKSAWSLRIGIVNTRARHNLRRPDDLVQLLREFVLMP